MKTIRLRDFGSVANFETVDLPVPAIREEEVLVKVKAISINPVDYKTRLGRYARYSKKENLPLILGWDISGEVVSTGAAVKELKTGDEVFGMVNFPLLGNAYAEYVASPAAHLALKPANISHSAAAAATLAALTAWQVLVNSAKVSKGQRVLVHAAAGGVGHYAVQIAKYRGAHVTGTSSAANRDFVLSLGADEHIDYRQQRFEEVMNDADIVLDSISGEEHLLRSLRALKPGGTLVDILHGITPEVERQAGKKGVKAYDLLVHADGAGMRELAVLLANGSLRSHVSHELPFEQMGEAHLQVESGRTIGKVVVVLP